MKINEMPGRVSNTNQALFDMNERIEKVLGELRGDSEVGKAIAEKEGDVFGTINVVDDLMCKTETLLADLDHSIKELEAL